ncbi:MAG: hypothetical protein D3M94_07275 [Rhodocyclales bacterium GT-UBC]|nr:MAG: hypothetical protein D3M94_07275 [Rhodocyclales bacterium GT-UBC]
MSLLAFNLSAAVSHSAALAKAKAQEEKEAAERRQIANAKRQRTADKRKQGAPNIKLVLLDRLPKAKEQAIPLQVIETLFADYKTCPSGISSALSVLCKEKQVLRTGERRAYNYYVNSERISNVHD